MRILRALLLLVMMTLANTVTADADLLALVKGTEVTPPLSGIQVALLEQGEVTETFTLGFAQRDNDGIEALRSDHKIRVASISKLVVAIGVMRLVERDQLALDSDVSRYLGWQLRNPNFPDTAITLRMLLDHTSSVRDGGRYFIAAGQGELKNFFDPATEYWDLGAHWVDQPHKAPGVYFEYANLNFGVIAEIIERVSGQRFDQFMEHEVITPLGMSGSFNPCSLSNNQRAAGFRKRDSNDRWNPDGPWYAQVDGAAVSCFYGMNDLHDPDQFLASYKLGSNASLFSPQGGFRADAGDLTALLRLLAKRGVVDGDLYLRPDSVAMMLAPSWSLNAAGTNGLSAGEAEPGGAIDGLMTSYGLSVHRIDARAWGFSDAPDLLVGHLGEAYGVLSHALLDPETGNGIATIITGTADDPAKDPGHSPLYRVEEAVLSWWLKKQSGSALPSSE